MKISCRPLRSPLASFKQSQLSLRQLSIPTCLDDHIDDGDNITMVQAFEDLDLANRCHGYLSMIRNAPRCLELLTPSRTLCVISFLRATALFVAFCTPFVTTLSVMRQSPILPSFGNSPKGPLAKL